MGDLASLRLLKMQNHDMQATDYDGRAPLHLAACQGQLQVVKFLVEKCKTNVDVKDRFKNIFPSIGKKNHEIE